MADKVIKINDAKVRSIEINSNPISVEEIEWEEWTVLHEGI